jgi:hypothetical protein
MIKLSKSTNRKIVQGIVILGLCILLMFFFRYKEVATYEYNGKQVKIALDRVKMKSIFCQTCDATFGVTEKELYYSVFLDDKAILRVKGDGSSEGCSHISANCNYIESDTLNILYSRPGAVLKIKLPLDGKKYSIKELNVLGYEHTGGLRCEDLRIGYGHSLKGIIDQESIANIIRRKYEDY